MDFGVITTIIGCVFGGGLIGFIEFLIRRKDAKQDKNAEILKAIQKLEKRIDDLDEREEMKAAVSARARILRFDDELRNKQKHSLEFFMEILRDIDMYEAYCKKNENFKNTFAVEAIANIKRVFRECKEENSFI